MFKNIKNNIGFSLIKKAISDKDGHINIKTRYYNTLMITYLQAKNELIFASTGIHLLTIDDIEEVYKWSEEFCKDFFMSVCSTYEADCIICPWCNLYLNKRKKYICTYGKRHGFCKTSCGSNKYKSTYKNILCKAGPIFVIPGMEDLYNFYKTLVLLKNKTS